MAGRREYIHVGLTAASMLPTPVIRLAPQQAFSSDRPESLRGWDYAGAMNVDQVSA